MVTLVCKKNFFLSLVSNFEEKLNDQLSLKILREIEGQLFDLDFN